MSTVFFILVVAHKQNQADFIPNCGGLVGNAKKLGDEVRSKSDQLKKAAKNGIQVRLVQVDVRNSSELTILRTSTKIFRFSQLVQESQSRLGSKAHHYGVGWRGHWATHKAMIVRDGQWRGVAIPQEWAMAGVKTGGSCGIAIAGQFRTTKAQICSLFVMKSIARAT